MKFTVETKLLAAALKTASVAATEWRTLPILGNVKIEARGPEIILSATNLDLYVTERVAANVSESGALSVPFQLLSRFVGSLESSVIHISATATEMELKAGDKKAVLEGLPAEEFPAPFPQDESALAVGCDAADLLTPFAKLAGAISTDQSRYTLMGVNVRPDNGGCHFAATNGTRIHAFKGEAISGDDVIIADVFVRALLNLKPVGPVKVLISSGISTVRSNGTMVSGKMIEGKFPNWQRVVPEGAEKVFSCNRANLISAIQTCAIFTEKETPGLVLEGKGKEIEVSLPGRASARILGTELSGQPDLSVRFNSRYMLDTLLVLDGEEVRIQCRDATSPMLIREGAFQSIMNPMQPEGAN